MTFTKRAEDQRRREHALSLLQLGRSRLTARARAAIVKDAQAADFLLKVLRVSWAAGRSSVLTIPSMQGALAQHSEDFHTHLLLAEPKGAPGAGGAELAPPP